MAETNSLRLDEVVEDESGEHEVSDDEEYDNIVDTQKTTEQAAERSHEQLADNIATICDFADGLEHQAQFSDWWMLEELERTGAGFFHMARVCLSRERRMNTTKGTLPMMWEKGMSSAMWYRARPP